MAYQRGSSYPALVAENPAQHAPAVLEGGALGDNGSGHGVVTTNTDTEKHTETEQPPHLRYTSLETRSAVDGEGDDHDYTDDGDDQLLAVDKLASESIAQEAERELTDDVTDVGCGIDRTTDEERNGRRRGLGGGTEVTGAEELVCPERGGQVDDEEIVGVQHETDTADHVELEVGPCEGPVGVSGLILLEGDNVAILVLASVGVFFPDRHDCGGCC